ncbi:MAG: pyruvate kinase [Oscillospiraceae bacterium]|nr:pyruvate kinase [Oscillospiraceae bacterium]
MLYPDTGRRTKIVCTLGPASASESVMEQLLRAGMNIARLNFSHGSHEGHKEMIDRFRKVRDKLGLPAAVMLDTKGPEIRICTFEKGSVELQPGDTFTLTTRPVEGTKEMVSITFEDLPRQLKKGDVVLLDDGRLSLEVTETNETEIHTTVTEGGTLSNRKGINLPGIHIDMEYLSEQDKSDLIFGTEMDVDYVAASFVRTADDVIAVRKLLDYYGGKKIKIISKIENLEGIANFKEILACSDGIMIARGDMGVEVEFEKLPGLQKKFIRSCCQQGKMVITATQMLESMITNASPTRAEITDVANAVFDGTSAIMLSGESAMGAHPVRAVEVMNRIARQAEQDALEMKLYRGIRYEMDANDTTNAICDATCTTAEDLQAKAIIAVTMGGQTAMRMAKFRPNVPIIAATPGAKTFHQLSLCWGVYPVLARLQSDSEALFYHAVACAKQMDAVQDGDRVVITAGMPLNTAGTTNTLKVTVVGSGE